MKRVVVLLAVVALMVVMVAMSVAPAFASTAFFQCTNPNTGQSAFVYAYGKHEAKLLGFTECHKL